MSFNKRVLSPGGLPFVNNENFRTVLYTGNGGTQSITGVGFKPDFVWLKNRSQSNYAPRIFDSSRGATKRIQSSSTSAESTDSTSLTSFDADGFTLGADNYVNNNGDSFVAWCWKAGGGTTSSNSNGEITVNVQANQDAGFSIVTFAGISDPGEDRSFAHGLSQEPEFIWMKRRESSQHPAVFAKINGGWEYFDGTSSTDGGGDYDSYIATTSTLVDIHDAGEWFADTSSNYVYWMWHSVAGYSKFGTYTGNASTNGPFVNTGFEPAFLMIKRVDTADAWYIYDNKRTTTNPRNKIILANANDAELTNTQYYSIDFLSNGFQLKSDVSTATNASGGTYLYMAFAENAGGTDQATPTLTSSFNINTYKGNGGDHSMVSTGFKPGMIWIKDTGTSAGREHILSDIVRGSLSELTPNVADAEESRGVFSFDTSGFSFNDGNANYNYGDKDYVAWSWKTDDNEPTINTNGSVTSVVSVNSAAGFSIAEATFGGEASIGHGLSQAPGMVILKGVDSAEDWQIYHSAVGTGKYLSWSRNNGTEAPTTRANSFSSVTSTTVTNNWTSSTVKWIMYSFHDVTGYQKIGSYTGDGNNDRAITTGFKPDFVMIKSTVGSDNWRIYDTRRGIKAGGYLEANRHDANDTSNAPNLTVTSTGFTITSGGVSAGNNADGNLYIYWAVAKNVPMNTTLANSFKTLTWTGNDNNNRSITGLGFRPDFMWIKRTNSAESSALYDAIRGANEQLSTDSSGSQATNSGSYRGFTSFDADGFSVGNNGGTNRASNTYVGWGWKAGNTWESNIDGTIPSLVNANTANGFSIVHWYGTQAAGATVGHGLSSAPEMIIVKRLDYGEDWVVYHSSLGNTKTLNLNNTDAEVTDAAFNNTTPTSSVFTLSNCASGSCINSNSGNYIAYCWHSVSGYSKFGSYTGNSSTGHSITGLGFQPDFVMIKRVDDDCSGSAFWFMFDSVRGAQYYLRANGNNQQSVAADATLTSFDSDGFTLGNDGCLNTGTMIYMAFKAN